MNWTTFAVQISAFFLGIPAVSVLAYYIVKAAIDATFKARAVAYEHELRIASQRDNIRFSTLHADRAKVIKELYLLIVSFHQYCIDYISLDGTGYTTGTFIESRTAVQECFQQNKLYFSEELSKQIEEIIEVAKKAVSEKAQAMQATQKFGLDKMKTDITLINKLTPDVLHKLEKEFRLLLGVE